MFHVTAFVFASPYRSFLIDPETFPQEPLEECSRRQLVTMVLRFDPSGFMEWMRSPLSSRRNNRPELVAVGEGFDLVAWSTAMIFPSLCSLAD
jgi:hypothetical protein